jgi:hypothetical protein
MRHGFGGECCQPRRRFRGDTPARWYVENITIVQHWSPLAFMPLE